MYGITDHLLAKPLQKEVNAFNNETHEYMTDHQLQLLMSMLKELISAQSKFS